MQIQSEKAPSRISKVKGAVLAVVLLFVAFVVLELAGVTHVIRHDTKPVVRPQTPTTGGASSFDTKGEPAANTATSGSSVDTNQPGDSKSNAGGDGSTNLIAPSGSFVSAHGDTNHPIGLGTTLSSVCNTSPGASCQIVFTQNSVTKSLETQTTDRSGATYWNTWTPASVGLTAGAWQVSAVASSGGQTKTAADALQLVLAQ